LPSSIRHDEDDRRSELLTTCTDAGLLLSIAKAGKFISDEFIAGCHFLICAKTTDAASFCKADEH